MLKLFVLTLRPIALTAALFILANDVWQGAPVLHFVGAAALGVIGPLGKWAIVKRYPNTDRAAWVCIGLTGAGVRIMALLRLVALLWA